MESNTIGSRLNTEETPPMIPMNDTEPEVLAETEPQNNSEIVSFDEALAKIMEVIHMEELNWKYWYTDVDKDQNQYTYRMQPHRSCRCQVCEIIQQRL